MLKSFIATIFALFAATFGLHHGTLPTTPTIVAPSAPTSAQITVINDYFAAPTTLIAGTRFETADDKIFHTQEPIIVPGKRGTVDGSIEISVTANAPGQIPTGRLTLPGLAASPKMYQHIFALAAAPTLKNDAQTASAASPSQTAKLTTPYIQDLSNAATSVGTSSADTPDTAANAGAPANRTSSIHLGTSALQQASTTNLNSKLNTLTAVVGNILSLLPSLRGSDQQQAAAYIPLGDGAPNTIAAASNIGQLTNVTVSGISGLTAEEIPSLSYLPLSGGTISGAFIDSGTASSTFAGAIGIGTSTPGSIFSVQGVGNWTTGTSTFYSTGGINLSAGCFAIAGNCVGLGSFPGMLDVNQGGTGWTNITSGSLLFGNGASALATSSNLFWDNTDGRLGIGTTTPTAILTVDSNSASGTVLRVSNSSTGGHIYDWLSTGSGNTGGAGRLDLFDYTAGAARLSIASNGNVGIGSTTPATTFSVAGNGYFTGNLTSSNLSATDATTSALVLKGGLAFSGNQTYAGTSSAANSYMSLSASLFGTAEAAANGVVSPFNLDISGDSVNTTSEGPSNLIGMNVEDAASTNYTGGRTALQGYEAVVGTPATTTSVGLVGVLALARGSANQLGTSGAYGDYQGSLFATNDDAYMTSGATDYAEITADEFDLTVPTGASAANEYGISITHGPSQAVRGTYDDDAIVIHDSDDASDPGWKYGLSFGSYAHQWAFATDSTLIMAQTRQIGSASPDVALNGVDFRNVTFGQYAFASNGFSVDASGDLSAASSSFAAHVGIGTSSLSIPLFVQGAAGQGTPSLSAGTVAAFQSNASAASAPAVAIIGGTTGTVALDFGDSNLENAGSLVWNNGTAAFHFSGGNLGVGTTTPDARLTVWGPDTASTSAFVVSNSASTTEFAVYDTGNAVLSGGLTQNSDQRLKTNVQSLSASSSLSAIDALNPVSFNWIDDIFGGGEQLGFIAQAVQQVFPQLISTTSPTALTPNGTLGLNYSGLIAPIIASIQGIAHISGDFENNLIGWLGSADNGVQDLFANNIYASNTTSDQVTATQELCVGTVCVTPAQFQAMVAAAGQSGSTQSSSGQGSGSNDSGDQTTSSPDTPPVIQINGDNPAIVDVGATYSDLGATITGPQADINLGITTYLNDQLVSQLVVDTSQPATDTIDYVATDNTGLAATSTRTVIIVPASPDQGSAATSTS